MARIDGLSDETKSMLVDRRPPGMTWDEFFQKSYEEGVPAYLMDRDELVDEMATRTAERTLAHMMGSASVSFPSTSLEQESRERRSISSPLTERMRTDGGND